MFRQVKNAVVLQEGVPANFNEQEKARTGSQAHTGSKHELRGVLSCSEMKRLILEMPVEGIPDYHPVSIDTVKLCSPPLSAEQEKALRKRFGCFVRVGGKAKPRRQRSISGELELANGSHLIIGSRRKDGSTRITIEGSVHKLILGQNLLGNPHGFQGLASQLVSTLQQAVTPRLPDFASWQVLRVDVSANFVLKSRNDARIALFAYQDAVARRAKSARFGTGGFEVRGKLAKFMVYGKWNEMKRHAAWMVRFDPEFVRALLDVAQRVIRVEVQVKCPKLEWFRSRRPIGRLITVGELHDLELSKIYDREVNMLNKDVDHQGKGPDGARVLRKLRKLYVGRRSQFLFEFYCRLMAFGEPSARCEMNPQTFSRKTRQLRQAGIKWIGVGLDRGKYYSGLKLPTFSRSDKRRLVHSVKDVQDLVTKCTGARLKSGLSCITS